MSEPAPDLSTGQLYAGWRVERELARGGMGVIYLARHPRLPRTDVIKVLSPTLTADQRFRERFLREAERMSTLSHPHVMPIHDSGESDGALYLVMPFIAGGDLRGLLRRIGRLEPARAARIVSQLAAALDAAHRIGVIHRDVKPENAMLSSVEPDETDHVLLTDFGISREQAATNTLTATGELLLTPAYAAPEQVLGKPTGAAGDQYALACVLFELLTGHPPYQNEAPLVMLMAHVQEPVPRIAERFGLPPGIDDVLARAMAKQPEQRYASCREFAKAATDVLAPAPLRQTTAFMQQPVIPEPVAQQPPPQRSKRRFVWLAAVVVLAAAGGVAAVLTSGGGSSKSNAAYEALLQRIPTGVRLNCTDTTGQLAAAERPYVLTRASCTDTIGGRNLTVAYRTLPNKQATIKKYRGEVLQLGDNYNTPGNCGTLTADTNYKGAPGTKGFSTGVNSTVIYGSVWCNRDGALWYLKLNNTGGPPVFTELHNSIGDAVKDAPQRYSDLQAVAPTS